MLNEEEKESNQESGDDDDQMVMMGWDQHESEHQRRGGHGRQIDDIIINAQARGCGLNTINENTNSYSTGDQRNAVAANHEYQSQISFMFQS